MPPQCSCATSCRCSWQPGRHDDQDADGITRCPLRITAGDEDRPQCPQVARLVLLHLGREQQGTLNVGDDELLRHLLEQHLGQSGGDFEVAREEAGQKGVAHGAEGLGLINCERRTLEEWTRDHRERLQRPIVGHGDRRCGDQPPAATAG